MIKMSSKRYPIGGKSLDLTRDATLRVIDKEIPDIPKLWVIYHTSCHDFPHPGRNSQTLFNS